MSSQRKKNHYVPQVYLKQWATDGKLPTYRLLVPNDKCEDWIDSSIKSVASREHLYTYASTNGASDEFERWFDSGFEAPAQNALMLATNDKQMEPEHWQALARFAFAQDVRTPAFLKAFIKRQEISMRDMLDSILQRLEEKIQLAGVEAGPSHHDQNRDASFFPLKVDVEKLADGSGHVKAEAVIGRKLWLWSIRHLLTNTIKKLPNHRWTIVRAPEGVEWPTSDNPLIRLAWSPSNYHFEAGWAQPNADILMPLSPKHLLWAAVGKRGMARGTILDPSLARQISRIIIEHADRYVFSASKFDISPFRKRIVCPINFNEEKKRWACWDREQSEAELSIGRKSRDYTSES